MRWSEGKMLLEDHDVDGKGYSIHFAQDTPTLMNAVVKLIVP